MKLPNCPQCNSQTERGQNENEAHCVFCNHTFAFPMKKVVVRWSAVYETTLTVPAHATDRDIQEEAANINLDVAGSEYQTDTWDVEKISSP